MRRQSSKILSSLINGFCSVQAEFYTDYLWATDDNESYRFGAAIRLDKCLPVGCQLLGQLKAIKPVVSG